MRKLSIFIASALLALMAFSANAQSLKMNDLDYYEDRGTNVLVYNNLYNGAFYDEKFAGIEIIQRGERICTGGGIRLVNTPEQWDIFGVISNRTVNHSDSSVEVELTYEDWNFVSKLRVFPKDKGVIIQVYLDKPVPEFLQGKAGMNLEFFPASYFGKNYLVDGLARPLPKYPMADTEVHPIAEKIPQYFGESTFDDRGRGDFLVPLPLSTGKQITLAPEDPALRVSVKSDQDLMIFDGRHLAQNGMFVLRSLLPTGKTGKVLEWYLEPSADPTWVRKPNIGFSQVGYTPAQKKVAVVELDKNDTPAKTANLLKVNPDGTKSVAKVINAKFWGEYHHRYNYVQLDFSDVKAPGLYSIEYNGVETNAFPIDKNVYDDKWHPSMDISLVVNMDHMEVNEAYRVWHGRANMDDALQAPLNIRLHDGYTMGNETNTKYAPLEHIPGLAIGGWYDAGDFDIQSNSVVTTTQDLAYMWRTFRPERDQTLIDHKTLYADIHVPDGIPDNVQYIMQGTLNINAQVENIGFVAGTIGQPDMHHYHHLGDAMTLTDGLIYDPTLARYEVKGNRSGTPDDRFVLTGRFSPAGTMGTIVSLAAAYPALKEYFPEEAERTLKNALMLWDKYSEAAAPSNNTNAAGAMFGRMGGDPRMQAAIELWFATGDQKFKDFFTPLVEAQLNPQPVQAPSMANGRGGVGMNLSAALEVYPYMDKKFQDKVKALIPAYVKSITAVAEDNPYGVNIAGATWAGNSGIINNAYNCYKVWKLFPDMIDPEFVFAGLNYLFGCHPYNNKSFITAVGVTTKNVAYSNNRADYSVIPGGVVPGLLVKEDFFENKDDYPFHWGENECCINDAPRYVELVLGAIEVAQALNK
ncbi:MAG: glycoside hydrolase family 9 protein [Bacteroidales bacterium]|nr:glycoside hydrolase family 9 protein [Bacteroidales bacterium]MBQ2500980.1 glycoside hydrolase family 9 protein [Bacteroidales bacterium]MBQ7072619.1 glycoside hydrolase family 9 protein [Bacteroidales bacterium]